MGRRIDLAVRIFGGDVLLGTPASGILPAACGKCQRATKIVANPNSDSGSGVVSVGHRFHSFTAADVQSQFSVDPLQAWSASPTSWMVHPLGVLSSY